MINLFKPSFRTEECLEIIRDSLIKGWTGLGDKTFLFEEEFKEYTDLEHCHFLNSATSALHLAVHILRKKYGWNDGDLILSTPLTFVSTNLAILYESMKPLFCDVDESLCLDLEDMKKKYADNKDKVKGIMFVGMGGNVGQLEKIIDWADDNDLPIILDAAHMCGTRIDNGMGGSIHIGHQVDAVCFSFQAVKNLPTGDSGAICFRDKPDDELVRQLSWLGIDKDTFARSQGKGAYKWKYDVPNAGFKYHGNSIMAGIGLVSLKYLDQDNAYRRQISKWYNEGLKNNPKIKIIPHKNCESSRHLYQILVDNRDELLMALNQNDIAPGVHYICNTEYEPFKYGKGTCSNAEKYQNSILSLPLHVQLTKKDIDYICEKLNKLT